MNRNKKREYTSPEMEILNARVERGFEASTVTDNTPRGDGNETVGDSHNNYNNAIFS